MFYVVHIHIEQALNVNSDIEFLKHFNKNYYLFSFTTNGRLVVSQNTINCFDKEEVKITCASMANDTTKVHR